MSHIYILSGQAASPGGLGDLAYIGLTSRPAETRINEHLYKLKNGTHSNQFVQDYYNIYGRTGITTGIIISAPEYYLNSLERLYIDRLNTFYEDNPQGWNRSRGGEGAAADQRPFALSNNGTNHFGTGLYLFLDPRPELDPSKIIGLLEGTISEYNGWRTLPPP